MISISTITADPEGFIVIEELATSNTRTATRRVNRTATLDGGCIMVDSGYSDSDRNLTIMARISESQAATLKAIFENNSLVCLAMKDGVFTGSISRLNTKNGDLDMTFLVKEGLT